MPDSLRGARVLVLRPEGQEEALADMLRARGADPVWVPAVSITPLDPAPIDEALARAGSFAWAIFTSANGVRLVAARGPLAFPRIAAIGPGTARALRDAGVGVDHMPRTYTTEGLAGELPGPPCAIVAFRAAAADTRMDDSLRARGFELTRVNVYDTEPLNGDAIAAAVDLGIDAVVLTSASIARAFASATAVPDATRVCAIGPATAAACTETGLRVDVTADEHTTQGLIDALIVALTART